MKKKSKKLCAWCAPSGIINKNTYANLWEMCEDAPSQLLGNPARLPCASRPHPACKKHKKYVAQEAVVCEWFRRGRGPHLFGGGNLGGKYGKRVWWEIVAGQFCWRFCYY